jgi:hypothetical protein
MVSELRSLGDISLKEFLYQTDLKIDDIYSNGRSFTELRRAAGFDDKQMDEEERTLLRGVGRMRHIDDSERIKQYQIWMRQISPPRAEQLNIFDRRRARMLSAGITSVFKLNDGNMEMDLIWSFPSVRQEIQWLLEFSENVVDVVHTKFESKSDVPLLVHALYSRIEIQAALDDLKDGRIKEFREGVRYLDHLKTDVFLFTADKSTSGFSPTTRYRDYAISSNLIHWESQSTTSSSSPTGKRYISHYENGGSILIFGRNSKNDDSFWFLGPARYVSHSGDYPIAFTWKLEIDLPIALFGLFAAAV